MMVDEDQQTRAAVTENKTKQNHESGINIYQVSP